MRFLGVIWPHCHCAAHASNIGNLDYEHGVASEIGNLRNTKEPGCGYVSNESTYSYYGCEYMSAISTANVTIPCNSVGQIG